MSRAGKITRLNDDQNITLPQTPIFFASRLLAEGRHTKVVEYCVIHLDGAVKLVATVTWNAEALRPGLWIPTSSALAALHRIGQLFASEVVVIAHDLEDEVLQPLPRGIKGSSVIEMRDLLSRKDLRVRVADLDDQIAFMRYDATRAESAYGDALLLKIYWDFVQAHLGGAELETAQPAPAPAKARSFKAPAKPRPFRPGVPAWAWGLAAAIIVQLLIFGAPFLFSAG